VQPQFYTFFLSKLKKKNVFLSFFTIVASTIGIGETVAGFCNDTIGNGLSGLQGSWGIYVSPSNGILYVADYDLANFQVFSPFSRIGRTLFSTGVIEAMEIFVDSSGTIYMTDRSVNNGVVYVQRAGINLPSFPAAGLSTTSCLFTGLYSAYGIATDQFGNIYISTSALSHPHPHPIKDNKTKSALCAFI
jgi:hypothetical protein